jgi:competence protein ComEC
VSLLITFGDAIALFTGDLETDGEQFLVTSSAASLDADVLQVGHHGAATSSTPEFLAAVTPIAAVVSAGEGNPYGHPSPAILDRIDDHVGESLYITSEDGTIELTTDGTHWFAKP